MQYSERLDISLDEADWILDRPVVIDGESAIRIMDAKAALCTGSARVRCGSRALFIFRLHRICVCHLHSVSVERVESWF